MKKINIVTRGTRVVSNETTIKSHDLNRDVSYGDIITICHYIFDGVEENFKWR